jgi:hypothetical protein
MQWFGAYAPPFQASSTGEGLAHLTLAIFGHPGDA